MKIPESEWVAKATENIAHYLHRGKSNEGDIPQLLGDTQLLNTIGVAMALPLDLEWLNSEDDVEAAKEGSLCYFVGKARETIDMIADKFREICEGDESNFVTILPIELYHEGMLHEFPLFRVQRHKDSDWKYVDNIGRVYSSFEDWYENSKLPPSKMAYPAGLRLVGEEETGKPVVSIDDTPSNRSGSTLAHDFDVISGVAGLAAMAASLVFSGGLAIPAVIVGTALWGTGRATAQLIDRTAHDETINPLKDSESRMLWFGLAANLANFGAMGASARLASLATRGEEISEAFRTFVDAVHGTNLAVSGVATLYTTIYMHDHWAELSTADVLFHIVSMAFWGKGIYEWKYASTLIREAQDTTFKQINHGMDPEVLEEFESMRSSFGNDDRLIRWYKEVADKGVAPAEFTRILLDVNRSDVVKFDADSNILIEGHTFSVQSLARLNSKARMALFETLANLNVEESESFKALRQWVDKDAKLAMCFQQAMMLEGSDLETIVRTAIRVWDKMSSSISPLPSIEITDGSVIIAGSPPVSLRLISQMSTPMTKFVVEKFCILNAQERNTWLSKRNIPIVFELQSYGLFTKCPVTKTIPGGSAMVELNRELQISIHALTDMGEDSARRVFELVGKLPEESARAVYYNSKASKEFKDFCITKLRLRFEYQRIESLEWMRKEIMGASSEFFDAKATQKALLPLVEKHLESYEKDRLYTAKSALGQSSYRGKVVAFSAFMGPRNVSEMVAYFEFAMEKVTKEKTGIEMEWRGKPAPHNVKKTWKADKAVEQAFESFEKLKEEFNVWREIAINGDMIGAGSVEKELGNEDLIAAVKKIRIKFGSETSAAYHAYKHPTYPPESYVERANVTIRFESPDNPPRITITQDGDGRLICFSNKTGTVIMLEKDGRVFLATYTPKKYVIVS